MESGQTEATEDELNLMRAPFTHSASDAGMWVAATVLFVAFCAAVAVWAWFN